jgi:hypothetical protein
VQHYALELVVKSLSVDKTHDVKHHDVKEDYKTTLLLESAFGEFLLDNFVINSLQSVEFFLFPQLVRDRLNYFQAVDGDT